MTPPELQNLPELPLCAAHLWEWFNALSGQRTVGMTVNPITWGDIGEWSRLTGNRPRQWELDAIIGMDNAFRASFMDNTE